jgi:hypothetical protein
MRNRHTKTGLVIALAALTLYLGFFSYVAHAQTVAGEQAKTMVDKYVKAQLAFDVNTLNQLTHSRYFEVSPVGEFDAKEKMLSFYAKKPNGPVPEIHISEWEVREFSNNAVIAARLNYKMQVGEQSRQFAMRASYVLCQEVNMNKICSAQYTPIRER